jgi:hypothetical protein
MHREMRQISDDPASKKQRKAFDRQRDIVDGGKQFSMNNSVFFDFRDKMTKPKGTNNFL